MNRQEFLAKAGITANELDQMLKHRILNPEFDCQSGVYDFADYLIARAVRAAALHGEFGKGSDWSRVRKALCSSGKINGQGSVSLK